MRRLNALLRVSVYLLVISLLLALGSAKWAHAKANEGALAFGEQLLQIADPESDARTLHINGQTIHVASAQTPRPLKEVLDHFQLLCEEHADGMTRDLEHLDGSLAEPPAPTGFPGIGMLRDERDARGVVVCFAAGKQVDTSDLGERLQKFSSTHDLADLGGLRYVAARAVPSGGTLMVSAWTEGSVRLDEMFPAHGDAAGEDPQIAPRPENARRVLSARDGRAPYAVFVYEMSGTTPDQALDAYAALAARAGFTRTTPERLDEELGARAFVKNGVDVVVTATKHENRTVVSVVEMPAGRAKALEPRAAR